MADASATAGLTVSDGKLCFYLAVPGTTVSACIALADLRSALNVGLQHQPIYPKAPPLPKSLIKRITPKEKEEYEGAWAAYNQKLSVATVVAFTK